VDQLGGGPGADRLNGGTGKDKLTGDAGNDRILARDRTRDSVRCGAGRDVAYVDRVDSVSGCETVFRR
jgi:Ca2+-binding RTX toxin-like protein